jgi:MFS-type transporter involved in bile tolerance (Atg22 family)
MATVPTASMALGAELEHTAAGSHNNAVVQDVEGRSDEQASKKDDDDREGSTIVAPDQFDPAYEATRKEIWSYYSYGVANNGLGFFNFAPTAFQNLLYIAASNAGSDTLLFAGQQRTINSIVLLSNGISCAINVVLFLLIGSLADYGHWRPWILIVWTVIAVALSMAWLGVHDPEKWHIAAGLYIVGLIVYQMCLSFWTAAFPGLARNTPEMRETARKYTEGEIDRTAYDYDDMMQRNRISNVSFIVQSAVEILILCVIVGIMFGLHVDDSQDQNNYGLSVLIAFVGGTWVLFALPWFAFEKRRPGQPLPPNTNFVTAGLLQLYTAGREVVQLKQSLLYLFGYFLLSDSLNTTVTVIGTLQSSIAVYNTLTLTYLLLVGIAAQLAGIFMFWTIQKRFRLSTKTMFTVVLVSIILLDGWGMIGIWTQRFGFHNKWELWVYQTFYGLFVCPWYSYSQIMISEITPRGREFLFFSLFGCFGRVSAFVGPIVSSAIIDHSATQNVSLPFYFLIGVSLLAALMLVFFLDLESSRREQAVFLAKQNAKLTH